MLYDIYLPYCLSIGVPYETFWSDGFNQRSIDSYTKAFYNTRKMLDENMWYMGAYINNAVSVAVEHCLAGKKAKSKYLKEPLLKNFDFEPKAEIELTEEEKRKKTENLFARLERMGNKFEKSKGGN